MISLSLSRYGGGFYWKDTENNRFVEVTHGDVLWCIHLVRHQLINFKKHRFQFSERSNRQIILDNVIEDEGVDNLEMDQDQQMDQEVLLSVPIEIEIDQQTKENWILEWIPKPNMGSVKRKPVLESNIKHEDFEQIIAVFGLLPGDDVIVEIDSILNDWREQSTLCPFTSQKGSCQ